jgi:hypothetical protein
LSPERQTLSLQTQGCQMGDFQTKNPTLDNVLECLSMKDVGKFYGHLLYFVAIW